MTKSITILTFLDLPDIRQANFWTFCPHSGRKLTKSDLLNKILIPGPLCGSGRAGRGQEMDRVWGNVQKSHSSSIYTRLHWTANIKVNTAIRLQAELWFCLISSQKQNSVFTDCSPLCNIIWSQWPYFFVRLWRHFVNFWVKIEVIKH